MKNSKIKCIILCGLCFAVLLLPLFFCWPGLAYKKWDSKKENRNITAFPPKIKYRKLPNTLETMYNDRVPFRSTFISWSQKFSDVLFSSAYSSKVLFGVDEFLFYTPKTNENTYLQYCGRIKLTNKEENRLFKSFQNVYNYFKSKNITVLFVTAPNKIDIYYDKLPTKRRFVFDSDLTPRQKIFEQLPQYIPQETILDLTPFLREARKKVSYPLYYRTDTHWNLFGSFVGFRAIIQKIAPELTPPPVEQLTAVHEQKQECSDLWPMTGLSKNKWSIPKDIKPDYPRYTGKIEHIEKKSKYLLTQNNTAPDKRTVVFVRDSFGNNLLPYFSNSFAEVHYLWGTKVNSKFIERIKPDIVIFESVARLFVCIEGYAVN